MRNSILILGGFDVSKITYKSLIKKLKSNNYKVVLKTLDTSISFETAVDNISKYIIKYRPSTIIVHSISAALLHASMIKNKKLYKNNRNKMYSQICIFAPIHNLDIINDIFIPDCLKNNILIPSFILKTIGKIFDLFSEQFDIFDNIKIYNIGLLTNTLQHVKDYNEQYTKFLSDINKFVVLSKKDKMVGYDKNIFNIMKNKFISNTDTHSSLLWNNKILNNLIKFIK